MRKLHLSALLPLILSSSLLFADQIVLKNGDRLTGTIDKSDDKTLLLKTDFAGDLTIQWSAVQEIQSTQQLHVATVTGKTVAGTVTTSDGNFQVQSPSGSQTVPKDQVTALRNDAEQTTFEKGIHPPLWQGWAGGATVGFALTAGNSETKSLNVAFTGDRKTTHDEITMYTNSVYSRDDSSAAGTGPGAGVTANTTQGGARYSRNFTTRLFGYVSGDFQTDALQFLNLRSILGGGLGVHLINTTQTTLDVLGGLNYTHESYSSIPPSGNVPFQAATSRGFAAATIGEELMHKLGASTVLTEKGYFFPDITTPDDLPSGGYRATFNFGTVTKLSKWLGWQNAFGDIYVSNPPLGTKKNDILLTTGLNISFTH